MRVVVDANILVAAILRPDGWTARELRREDVVWVAPQGLVDELRAHEQEIADKADISKQAVHERVAGLIENVELVPQKALVAAAAGSEVVQRALDVDPKDAMYLACVEATRAGLLWTRDRGLLTAFPGLAVRVVPRPSRP